MSQTVAEFAIHLSQTEGYQFKTRFDKEQYVDLVTDEPAPLGQDSGPNPSRLMAAAIGNCLAASLLFCLSKQGAEVSGLSADVRLQLVRNERRRLRIGKIDVTLHPRVASDEKLNECLDAFEDFCVVTQSVREGLDIDVQVEPAAP